MRPIKFRAWDKEKKQMWHNQFCVTSNGEIQRNEIAREWHSWQAEKWELMQFTGLLDKNGKEIYSGDLVKHPMLSEPTEVKWLNVGWTPFMSYHAGEDYEVVGNIYEQPELLK